MSSDNEPCSSSSLSPSKKRVKLTENILDVSLNEKFKDQDVLTQLSKAWQEGIDYTGVCIYVLNKLNSLIKLYKLN